MHIFIAIIKIGPFLPLLLLCLSISARGDETGPTACGTGGEDLKLICDPAVFANLQKLNEFGQKTVKVCVKSNAKGLAFEGVTADHYRSYGISKTSTDGAMDAATTYDSLISTGAATHGITRDAFLKLVAECKQIADKFNQTAEMELGSVNAPTNNLIPAADQCKQNINSFQSAVNNATAPCLTNMMSKVNENGLGEALALKTAKESKGIGDMLKGNMGSLAAGAAIGAGALYLFNSNKDKDKDKAKDGNVSNSSFNVTSNADGGQCVKYDKDKEKCYTNEELSRMCFATSSANNVAYPFPGLAEQQEQTKRMQEALCTAFKQDTRDGGGGDGKTCYTNKTDYFKDAACESRLTTQCMNTDFGDCAKFNDFYCYNDVEVKGKGSNYCVFRESKAYCDNGGNSNSPSCTWMRQLEALGTNGGSSCFANINQASCYPNGYETFDATQTACNNLNIMDKDPLCKNINNSATYFSWRNPATPGGSQNLSGDGGGSGGNGGSGNNLETADACVKPTEDCTLPNNRSTPQCVRYYCCQPRNASAPICQSLSIATATSLTSQGSVNTVSASSRYPAGSLPRDVSSYRSESLFTATSGSSIRNLCEQGELYDCGALSGYSPR